MIWSHFCFVIKRIRTMLKKWDVTSDLPYKLHGQKTRLSSKLESTCQICPSRSLGTTREELQLSPRQLCRLYFILTLKYYWVDSARSENGYGWSGTICTVTDYPSWRDSEIQWGKKILLFLVAVTPKDRRAWILQVVLILTRMTEEFGAIWPIKSSARHPSPVSFSWQITIGASHFHAQQLFP